MIDIALLQLDSINTTNAAVLGIYFIFVLAIGLFVYFTAEKSASEYFVANRSFGVLVLTFTTLATLLSAFTVFGLAESGATTGLGTTTMMSLTFLLGMVFLALIGLPIAKIAQARDYLTPTEYLNDRFNTPLPGFIFIVVAFLFVGPMIAAQVIGGALVLDVFVGIPENLAIVIIVSIMAAYIMLGGLRAAAYTDVVQGAILLFGIVFSIFMMLFIVGEAEIVSGVMNQDPQLFEMPGPVGAWEWTPLLTTVAFFMIGWALWPQTLQRFYSAESVSSLKKSLVIFVLLGVLIQTSAAILGMWGAGIVGVPEMSDHILAVLFTETMHPLFVGLILAAAVAAIQSTAGSVALALAGLVVRDIYTTHLNTDISSRREGYMMRAVVGIVFVFGTIVALYPPGTIFDLVLLSSSGFAAMYPGFFAALYWKRATSSAVSVSFIVGPAVVALGEWGMYPAYGVAPGFIGIIVGVILVVGLTPITKSVDPAELQDITVSIGE